MKTFILVLYLFPLSCIAQNGFNVFSLVDSIVVNVLHTQQFSKTELDSILTGLPKDANASIKVHGPSIEERYPLVVVNNIPITPNKLKEVDQKYLKSITVLEPKKAIKIYGFDGIRGVIILNIKKRALRDLKKNG